MMLMAVSLPPHKKDFTSGLDKSRQKEAAVSYHGNPHTQLSFWWFTCYE